MFRRVRNQLKDGEKTSLDMSYEFGMVHKRRSNYVWQLKLDSSKPCKMVSKVVLCKSKISENNSCFVDLFVEMTFDIQNCEVNRVFVNLIKDFMP